MKLAGTCCKFDRLAGSTIVENALRWYDDGDYTEYYGEYNTLTNNCECFALVCCLSDEDLEKMAEGGVRQGAGGTTPVVDTVLYPATAGARAFSSFWTWLDHLPCTEGMETIGDGPPFG